MRNGFKRLVGAGALLLCAHVAIASEHGASEHGASEHGSPTAADNKNPQEQSIERDQELLPDSASELRPMRLSIEQVFFPGVPDRTACRMQIRVYNDSRSTINLRLLIQTSNVEKEPQDSWLVPAGDLKPGEEVLRLFSCRPSVAVDVMRNSDYGWPITCRIDGDDVVPCPVNIKFHSSLAIPPVKDPNFKEEKKKPEKAEKPKDDKKKKDEHGGGEHH